MLTTNAPFLVKDLFDIISKIPDFDQIQWKVNFN